MSRWLLAVLVFCCFATSSHAREPVQNLDQLLAKVKQQQVRQRELNRQREQEFLADKQRQQQLLEQARSEFERQQQENQPLVAITERKAARIERLQEELEKVSADMGDLSSTFREFAGDFSAVLRDSMVSAQLPQRLPLVEELAAADGQVTIKEIQALWLLLQEDMTESGRITRFDAPVIDNRGAVRETSVLRVGVFSAWQDGMFLRYVPETAELLTLGRQPPGRFQNAAREFASQDGVLRTLAVDPTRGSLLGMLSFTPDLRERIEQGGSIGLIILGLGFFGLLLTLWRLAYLLLVAQRIRRQLPNIASPNPDNPLGRVLLAVKDVATDDDELLQLKLDEAVLAEIPALERGNGLIKLFAATSPLLGLLGTVTGMILTFQAISLFGTGDPKLMAGGISQALVTTVLGLVVAIPLLFGHSVVAYLARNTIQRLDEQCAGALARSAEGEGH